MSSEHPKRDRRRHPRVTCPATMHVYCGTRPAGRFSVRNLSAGGALIGPEAPLEPCVAEDVLYTRARGQLDADILFETEKAVRVVLELPGMDAVPLRAHVVRLDHDRAGGPTVALAFSHDHPDTEDIIQDAVLRALERQQRRRVSSVLVVDDERGIRDALARELAQLNREALLAASLAEARRRLESRGSTIEAAIIDVVLGHDLGLELVDLLAESYPEVRRIVMSGRVPHEALEPMRIGRRAHAVLHKPWRRAELARALVPGDGPGPRQGGPPRERRS